MWITFVRLILALAAALVGIGLFLYSDHTLKSYYHQNTEIRSKLQTLQTQLYALEGEVLRNSSYLYYNYDNTNRLLLKTKDLIDQLINSPFLNEKIHRKTFFCLKALSKEFQNYTEKVEDYLTLNASLKNSIIYIPTLQLRAYSVLDSSRPEDRNTLLLLSKINASIFLAKNAQDPDFLHEIKKYFSKLQAISKNYDGAKKRLLITLQNHLARFIRTFPLYTRKLDQLLHSQLIPQSTRLFKIFQTESGKELDLINQMLQLLLLLYLLSLLFVGYFIVRTYRENYQLRKLKRELEQALITDPLTSLGNRNAYRQQKSRMHSPCLILVNIDRFKHINEFYGTHVGDQVLIALSTRLQKRVPSSLHAIIYRMGGDDFGILFEREKLQQPIKTLVKDLHKKLEECHVEVEGIEVDLSFSLGASDQKEWLFETADMALKAAKNSTRDRFAVYSPALDKREEIASNIQILRNIREALTGDHLIPYFQPIYNVKRQEIYKFEALARIELEQGAHILQPSSFIRPATEAKLSGDITLRILERTLEIASKESCGFSVNIAADDISNTEDRRRILDLLKKHQEIAHRITFEILESEEIKDYDQIAEVIRTLKRLGCQIAIDDFGSGYSNFEKILQLDIDILKIDGSLIRKIDHDRHSELIVKTILDFAHQAGLETIAEFVHSKSVCSKVKALGFDALQGYYIGKPAPHLQKEFPGQMRD